MRDDVFDARFEEVVVECCALEFGRDSSASEEQKEQVGPEEEEEEAEDVEES